MAQGSTQSVAYKAGFVSSTYTENVKVYIDWNQNGSFADAGETVASGTPSTSALQTASFTVPAAAKTGQTRMRVVLSDNTATTSCGTYSYGETEDYSVTVTGGTGCGGATGLTAAGLTSSGATLSWTAVSGANSYNVQYRPTGATAWTGTSTTTTSKTLAGLAASTAYEFQVQTVCASGSSTFSASATFTTGAAGGGTPTYCASKGSSQSYEYISYVNIGSITRTSGADGGYYNGSALSTGVSASSAQTLTFAPGFTGSAYTENWFVYVDWNQNGTFESTELMDSGPSTSTGNLTSTWTVPTTAKNGKARLRIVMSDNSATTACGTYSYGETEDYTLTVTGGTFAALAGPAAGVATLTLYPNPASELLHLVLPDQAVIVTVQVLDVRGATVASARYEGDGQLNVAALASGLYTVHVSDGLKTYTQRFVKQ